MCQSRNFDVSSMRTFLDLKNRITIRQIINQCLMCKLYKVKPAETLSAPLTEDRVREAATYEIAGLDICCPLFLKNGLKI